VLGVWGDAGTRVVASEAAWREPRKWDRAAAAAGDRHRVFCASLADVFEDRPNLIAPRIRLFHLISETPNLDWLLLTKRPENVRRFCVAPDVPRSWSESMPPNCWLGCSVENQATADERIPHLLRTPAAVRFLSVEPLLAPVDLTTVPGFYYPGATTHDALAGRLYHHDDDDQWTRDTKVDWVIVGGESGPKARPMHPQWARDIRDQCVVSGTPYFFKQWGGWFPADQYDYDTELPRLGGRPEIYVGPQGGIVRTSSPFAHGCPCDVPPGYVSMVSVGKHAAGRLLDGVTWDQFPQPREFATS